MPDSWFQHPLLQKDGRGRGAHLVATLVLSEIAYWYRPNVINSENGSDEFTNKFNADKVQLSYIHFTKKFGFTRDQVKAAAQFLKDRGLLLTETRNLSRMSNVLYVELTEKVLDLFLNPMWSQTPQGRVVDSLW